MVKKTPNSETLNIEFADCRTRAEPVGGHARVLADIIHLDLVNIQHCQAVFVPKIILLVRLVKLDVFVIPAKQTALN